MRKILLGVLETVVVLSLCATTAFAAGPGGGCHFVDVDGDGICDNFEVDHWYRMAGVVRGRNFVDVDGDGVCDNYASGQCPGVGGNYVDADGDGVCDNYASGQGQGGGCGRSSRGGCGNGFRGGRRK